MTDFINGLIWAALGPVRDIVVAVASRLSAIWSTLTNIFALLRRSYNGWAAIIRPWADATARNSMAALLFSAWLVRVGMPRLVGGVADNIAAWVLVRIDGAVVWVVAIIGNVRDGLLALIVDAVGLLAALRDWTLARVQLLDYTARRLLDHVFGPLASPQRVVAWIFAPLISALVAWVLDNIDALAENAMRRRRHLEAQALTLTERVLDRIL